MAKLHKYMHQIFIIICGGFFYLIKLKHQFTKPIEAHLKFLENKWIHIPYRNDRTLHHTLTCNFLKVFIEILQSCYNPVL